MKRVFLIILLLFLPVAAFADAEAPEETHKIRVRRELRKIDLVAPIREMVLRNKTAIYSFIGLYAVYCFYLDPLLAKWEEESRIAEAVERRKKQREFNRRVGDLILIEDTKEMMARMREEEREAALEREAEEIGYKDNWWREDDE